MSDQTTHKASWHDVAALAQQLAQGEHGFVPKDRLADAADVHAIGLAVQGLQEKVITFGTSLETLAHSQTRLVATQEEIGALFEKIGQNFDRLFEVVIEQKHEARRIMTAATANGSTLDHGS